MSIEKINYIFNQHKSGFSLTITRLSGNIDTYINGEI